MRTLKIVLLATVAAAALSTATRAADPIMMVDEPAPMAAAVGWDGPYAGLFVLGQTTPGSFGIGADVGVNFSTDGLLLGVEGDAAWLSAGGWDGQVTGRVGVMAADQAALYALAGFGADSFNGAYVPVGAGVELGVAENLSVRAEYQYHWDLGAPGGNNHVGKIGLNWHF